MWLKAIRSHFGPGGNVQAVCSEYSAPDPEARMLIATGKAVAIQAPAAPAATPAAKPKPIPMTTKSAPALMPGAPDPERTTS